MHGFHVAQPFRAAIASVAIAIVFPAGLKGFATTIAEARAGAAEPAKVFRWAGDPEGGAPFVEADPRQPDRLVGFDVEVAALIAAGLGRTPRFVFVTFTSIDQSVDRGDADIGLSGIEDTRARRASMAATIPY